MNQLSDQNLADLRRSGLSDETIQAVFYPTNLLLYRWLDVNTAYNASLLLHFVAAFGVTCLFARRLGIGSAASLLTALVFVYSWFPPRICLEWAIIGAVGVPNWSADVGLYRRHRII